MVAVIAAVEVGKGTVGERPAWSGIQNSTGRSGGLAAFGVNRGGGGAGALCLPIAGARG